MVFGRIIHGISILEGDTTPAYGTFHVDQGNELGATHGAPLLLGEGGLIGEKALPHGFHGANSFVIQEHLTGTRTIEDLTVDEGVPEAQNQHVEQRQEQGFPPGECCHTYGGGSLAPEFLLPHEKSVQHLSKAGNEETMCDLMNREGWEAFETRDQPEAEEPWNEGLFREPPSFDIEEDMCDFGVY